MSTNDSCCPAAGAGTWVRYFRRKDRFMSKTITRISPVTLALEEARRLTDRAVAEAETLGIPYTITVLDGGGNTVQVTRMDGAALASVDLSLAKARTAV